MITPLYFESASSASERAPKSARERLLSSRWMHQRLVCTLTLRSAISRALVAMAASNTRTFCVDPFCFRQFEDETYLGTRLAPVKISQFEEHINQLWDDGKVVPWRTRLNSGTAAYMSRCGPPDVDVAVSGPRLRSSWWMATRHSASICSSPTSLPRRGRPLRSRLKTSICCAPAMTLEPSRSCQSSCVGFQLRASRNHQSQSKVFLLCKHPVSSCPIRGPRASARHSGWPGCLVPRFLDVILYSREQIKKEAAAMGRADEQSEPWGATVAC